MSGVQVILFDLDDTLFDHRHCSRAGLAAVREQFSDRIDGTIEAVEAEYRSLLERLHLKVLDGSMTIDESRVERFRILLSKRKQPRTEEPHAAATVYRNAYDAAYRAVPGAIELLRKLRADAKIGVVTNHVVEEQVKKIALIGIEPHIDELIVSEEVGVAKPDPHIFRTALERLGGNAEAAVMIGDSWSSDIEGATGVGIRAIWMNRYGEGCPDIDLAHEIHAFEPVDDVAALIRD